MSSDNQVALSRPPRIPTTNVPKNARQGVPAFLQKLYEMLNNTQNQDLIRWSDAGDSFYVLDPDRFAKEVLGRWFKHQNFSSFVRQLNMYGFHKIPHLQQGVLRSEGDTEFWNFEHPNFRRDQPDLLHLIQRKKQQNAQQQQQLQQSGNVGTITAGGMGAAGTGVGIGIGNVGEEGMIDVRDPTTPTPQSSSTNTTSTSGQVLDVSAVLASIAAVKRHQTTISEELNQLKQSNQILWHESLTARDRLQKQQDMINRIVKFLAGVFGNQATGDPHGHHPGHSHEKGDDSTRRNEGAVVPVRSSGVPRRTAAKPRLMIEGAKQDSSGKTSSTNIGGVGIVEVLDQDAGGDILDVQDDDEDLIDDDEDDEDMNMNTPTTTYNTTYAVETPASVPSPSPSVAQSDAPGSTLAETSTTNIPTHPSSNYGSNKTNNISSTSLDTIMHDSTIPHTSSALDLNRAVTPSILHHTSTSSPSPSSSSNNNNPSAFEIDPRTFSNITPEYFASLLAFLSQNDNSTVGGGGGGGVDPGLGFPGVGEGQLTTATGNMPSPTSFDLSSLGFPALSPSPSGPTTSTNTAPFPALITGGGGGGGELPSFDHHHDSTPVIGAVSPRLERHWRDVQDVDNDVAASESQINQLIETLSPFLSTASNENTNIGMIGDGIPSPSTTTTTTQKANLSNPQLSAGGTLNGGDDHDHDDDDDAAETDISSLDPTHLSIPTNLHHTNFFDSFFSAPSPSSMNQSPTRHERTNSSTSTTSNLNLTNSSGIIDSTMDSMNMALGGGHGHHHHLGSMGGFDMGDIPSSSFNDLSGAETAFLDSPVINTTTTTSTPGKTSGVGGSPQQSMKNKPPAGGFGPTTTSSSSRKRKSDLMAMDDLEGALLGTTTTPATTTAVPVPSVSTSSSAETGTKIKRRKE